MRNIFKIICCILLLCTLYSCERRELVNLETTHYIRVYIDEQIKNVTTGFYNNKLEKPHYKTPEVVRVIACDPSTDEVVYERYLQNKGQDEKGKYIDGYISIPPGNYKLMAYSFGSESSIVRNDNTYNRAEAYTNTISPYLYGNFDSKGYDKERIVYDPDHLFVDTNDNLHIGYKSHVDTLYNVSGEHFKAQSIVKTYYLQVTIVGAQYITNAVALLSGLGGSSVLHTGTIPNHDPATVYFDMVRPPEAVNPPIGGGSVTANIYANFGTFGKLEGLQNNLEMAFNIITVDGRRIKYTMDITQKFYEANTVENQWIIIDEKIVVPPPADVDSGFKPNVNEWDEYRFDILI